MASSSSGSGAAAQAPTAGDARMARTAEASDAESLPMVGAKASSRFLFSQPFPIPVKGKKAVKRAAEHALETCESADDKDEIASQAPSAAPSAVGVPDPCPLKRIPPNVLRDKDYNEVVSELIERDYFPDLPQLRLKHKLYNALAEGEEDLAQSLQWQLANMRRPTPASTLHSVEVTPMGTPATDLAQGGDPADLQFHVGTARGSTWEGDDRTETESVAATDAAGSGRARLKTMDGKRLELDLAAARLDDFQRLFTSEDTASFEKILGRDKEKVRAKQWWIEAMEHKHNSKHKAQVKALAEGGNVEPGDVMSHEFKGRNALSFHQQSLLQEGIQKPRVDVKNTRFSTAQQQELDNMLCASFQARKARLKCERLENAYEAGAKDSRFKSLPNFLSAMKINEVREVAGRIETPLHAAKGRYPLMQTPSLAPGEGNLSPLMTFGKVGSTPRPLADPTAERRSFCLMDTSAREEAADKLQRAAMLKHKESQKAAKASRMRAMGLTPGRTPLSSKLTPAHDVLASKVTALSPIGQIIHTARKLAQRGGQLKIGSASAGGWGGSIPGGTPRSEAPARKKARRSSDGATGSLTDGLL